MSEPAFTPGPWRETPETRAVEICTVHCITPRSVPYAIEGQRWIYIIAEGSTHRDEREQDANAYLIAAAPDLYIGCSAMLGLVQLILNRDDLSPELRAVLQADNHRIAEAEAALAKADGPS